MAQICSRFGNASLFFCFFLNQITMETVQKGRGVGGLWRDMAVLLSAS